MVRTGRQHAAHWSHGGYKGGGAGGTNYEYCWRPRRTHGSHGGKSAMHPHNIGWNQLEGQNNAAWSKQNRKTSNWYTDVAVHGQDDGEDNMMQRKQGMGRGRVAVQPAWQTGAKSSVGNERHIPKGSTAVVDPVSVSSNSKNILHVPAQKSGLKEVAEKSNTAESEPSDSDVTLNGTWHAFGSPASAYAEKYSRPLIISEPVPNKLQQQLDSFVDQLANGNSTISRSFVVTAEHVTYKSLADAPSLLQHSMEDWAENYSNSPEKEFCEVLGVGDPKLELCKVEQDSVDGEVLDNAFVLAVVTAWCKHLPLVLKPDHILLLILQGIARHVNDEPEELRSRLVTHGGREPLFVEPDDCHYEHMMPQVVEMLRGKINDFATPAAKRAFNMSFSTSSHSDRTVADITMMDATKHFFEFWYAPMCGFPTITLMGSVEDWRTLRRQAEDAIKNLTSFDFASAWLRAILPVLDRFVAAANGEPVDACFWNAMCKRCGITGVYFRAAKSVGYNGWMHVFFPSIGGHRNPLCSPYSASAAYVTAGLKDFFLEVGPDGAEVEEADCKTVPADGVPSGLGKVPLVEKRPTTEIEVELYGGFVGFMQDKASKALCPAVSWYLATPGKDS